MHLILQRKYKTEYSTIGDLAVDGQHQCFILEPPMRTDDVKPRAIPAGTYQVTLRYSERFKRIMPHIENVSGFVGIEIHWGNYPGDTEACLLTGENYAENYVGNSRPAFHALFSKLVEPISITILDPLDVGVNIPLHGTSSFGMANEQ